MNLPRFSVAGPQAARESVETIERPDGFLGRALLLVLAALRLGRRALCAVATFARRRRARWVRQATYAQAEERVLERARSPAWAEAERAARLYEAVARNAQLGLVVFHLEEPGDPGSLRIELLNPATARVLGVSIEATAGTLLRESFPKLLETPVARLLAEVASTGKAVDLGEVPYGDERIARGIFAAKAFPLPQGRVGVFFENVTARKEMEEALADKTRRLERSNAELELFASIASHELQEPVRKILTFGALVKPEGGRLSAEQEGYLYKMTESARRMQRLIEDVLSLCRASSDGAPTERVELGALLARIGADFASRLRSAGAELLVGPLPAVTGHPFQLRQLFENLLSNALKFRDPRRAPRVEILSERDGDRVRILVKDNGIGFEEQYRERIFKPFQRLHPRGKYEGTGIGLALCERVAARHGGSISARSVPGEGSVFVLELQGTPLPG